MFDLELLVSSHSQIVRQRFHLYHFKVVIDSKIGQTKFIAFLEGIFEFEEIECKQECDMFSLRIQFTSCLNIEKIVIELHSLTGIQLKEWLPLFYLPIDPLQHVRNMIRVGTFDDKISKISIADLSHDLVQLPFLACIILIAILCFPSLLYYPSMYFRISQTVQISRKPITFGFWVTDLFFCTVYYWVIPIFFQNFFSMNLSLFHSYFYGYYLEADLPGRLGRCQTIVRASLLWPREDFKKSSYFYMDDIF